MATLLIRNVNDVLHSQLKARARAHHRSLEAEVRETLRGAMARQAGGKGGESLLDLASRLFGPDRGFDLDLPPRGSEPQRPPPDFSGPEYDR